MHELGITQSILSIALEHAQNAGAVRIKEINLVIGELSSIVDDSVQFYWDMIAKGTIAEGAQLNFKRLPAWLHCNVCGHEFPMNREKFECPECGSDKIVVASGEEFFLESIDVDLAPEAQSE
ncbi:MAG: hydrogenase maturation nickel metallochaperone HypA [Chloroflexi bacterium]|nr:hydrogenase maturation nickel metallochaperone HypA [Chloroflexota bacterium]